MTFVKYSIILRILYKTRYNITFTKYFSPLKATGLFDLDLGIYLDQRFYLAIKLYCALYLLDNYGLFTKYPVKRIYCCPYSFNIL